MIICCKGDFMIELDILLYKLNTISHWTEADFLKYSLSAYATTNYIRLKEKLDHILENLDMNIVVEQIFFDKKYYHFLCLEKNGIKNYLLPMDEENFFTTIDNQYYILTLPELLLMDRCQLSLLINEYFEVTWSCHEVRNVEKITYTATLKNAKYTCIIPYNKRIKQLCMGLCIGNEIIEFYIHENPIPFLRYYQKKGDHIVELQYQEGYHSITREFEDIEYIYQDTREMKEKEMIHYRQNLNFHRQQLMEDSIRNKDVHFFLKTMYHLFNHIDSVAWKRLCAEYDLLQQIDPFTSEGKKKQKLQN